MSIPSNDLRRPVVNVKLSGVALLPKISVAPRSINFGNRQSKHSNIKNSNDYKQRHLRPHNR